MSTEQASHELAPQVVELTRGIAVKEDGPALPAEAIATFLSTTSKLPPKQRERLAEECLAVMVRVIREVDDKAVLLVAQLYEVVAVLLSDLDRADDLFAAAGFKSARDHLLGVGRATFEEKDVEAKAGVLNLLSTKK